MNEVSSEAVSAAENNGGVNAIVQHKVPFYEAAKRYLTKPTSKGRSSRSEFWWGFLFSFILDLGLCGIFGETAIYNVFALAIFVFDVFLWWRRMQDLGKTGWWCVVPFYNLYLAVQPSEMKENKYGPVPNTQPIPENVVLKNVIIGVVAVSALSALIGGCLGGDSAENAFERYAASIRDKDAEKFFSCVYIEGVDSEQIAVKKDLLDMMFEKLMREMGDEKTLKLLTNPEILDVIEADGETYVKFAAGDEGLRAQFAAEGLSGMMIKAVETDEGWKICMESMRPVFASKEEKAAAAAKANEAKASQAIQSLEDASIKGRRLFVAIVQANTEREGAGLASVWPHLAEDDGLGDEQDDIAGKKFSSSTEYFRFLFDVENCKKGDWSPYVSEVGFDVLSLCGDEYKSGYFGSGNVNWMVVAGITDEMDDNFPVLISANIEPSYLTFAKGRKNIGSDGRRIPVGSDVNRYGRAPWWNEAVVVIRKGGKADVIRKDECTMKALFKADTVEVLGSAGVKCLEP